MATASCGDKVGLVHLVPYPNGELLEGCYQEDHKTLIDLLQSSHDGLLLRIYGPEIHSPYPIGITLTSLYRMKKAAKILSKAIHAVISNYFKDERLCGLMLALSTDAKSLLSTMQDRPYHIGSWRPDVLFPATDPDNFKICEINARYAFNGYFCSHEKNKILHQLAYMDTVPVMPVSELDDIPELFTGFFDSEKAVGILKIDALEGWDVKLFHNSVAEVHSNKPCNMNKSNQALKDTDSITAKPDLVRDGSFPRPSPSVSISDDSNELRKLTADNNQPIISESINTVDTADIGVRYVHPSSLSLDLSAEGEEVLRDAHGPLQQFAIECSQSELLAMNREVLTKLISYPHINDIRTIFIAHDKRMLSVLSNPDIMKDYLDSASVDLLMEHVIPTYICGVHLDVVETAKKDRCSWLIKPNGGGKGAGIVFGRDCESDQCWSAILDDPAHSCYVLQQVVVQQLTDIQRESSVQKMLVVGIMHCFNDRFLGPGIYRASTPDSPIVNVSGGNGIILSPAIVSSRWKLTRKQAEGPVSSSIVGNNLLFKLPTECVFDLLPHAVDSNGIMKYTPSKLDDIWDTLNAEGIALINCSWDHGELVETNESPVGNDGDFSDRPSDSVNALMINLIEQLGGEIHGHNLGGSEELVWDVRPLFDSVHCVQALNPDAEGGTRMDSAGGTPYISPPPPRSHTADVFHMHTDCSFEDPPPRYIALYVVQEDRCGGGYSTLIDTEALNRYISRESLMTFLNTDFIVSVPQEFHKGVDSLSLKLLTKEEKLWKYRADIIQREKCTDDQISALNELDSLLQNPALVLTTMLPTGSMLLLDNMRWFHGRSAIKDNKRWLKRIRFNPSPSRMPPPPLQRLVSRSESASKVKNYYKTSNEEPILNG